MPIRVELQNESGEVLDVTGEAYSGDLGIAERTADQFRLLRYVDPYGQTVFNHLQIDDLVLDLGLLADRAKTERQRDLIEGVMRLARRCGEAPHLYLKFVGD